MSIQTSYIKQIKLFLRAVCTYDLGQDSPIQTYLAWLIRVLIIIYYPGCRRLFFSLEATELNGETAKASCEVVRKKYFVLKK